MHSLSIRPAMALAEKFPPFKEASSPRVLLDVGGGSGIYCIASAVKHSAMHAIVFDIPPVISVSKEFIFQYAGNIHT